MFLLIPDGLRQPKPMAPVGGVISRDCDLKRGAETMCVYSAKTEHMCMQTQC